MKDKLSQRKKINRTKRSRKKTSKLAHWGRIAPRDSNGKFVSPENEYLKLMEER